MQLVYRVLLLVYLQYFCVYGSGILVSFLSIGGGVPIPSVSSAVPAQSQSRSCTEDRYAALAELDNKLSSSASTGSNVQG